MSVIIFLDSIIVGEGMKKISLLMVIGTLLIMSLGVGISYSMWNVTATQGQPNVITTGCFSVSLTPSSSGSLSLTNQYPMIDDKGTKLQAFTFTISNTCSVKASYTVYLNALSTSTMDGGAVKVQWNDGNYQLYSAYPVGQSVGTGGTYKDSRKMATGTLNSKDSSDSTVTYSLRLWIDNGQGNDIATKSFYTQVVVDAVNA